MNKSKLQLQFRRAYADVAPAKKPRRFRFLRYLWRATYLSAIGGIAYLAYGVWDLRHPDEQFEPDPTKKNLVILGMSCKILIILKSLCSDMATQVLDGVQSPFLRNSTPKIIM
jgi:NADH:ubiquinone reductase (non-electrogenic)